MTSFSEQREQSKLENITQYFHVIVFNILYYNIKSDQVQMYQAMTLFALTLSSELLAQATRRPRDT